MACELCAWWAVSWCKSWASNMKSDWPGITSTAPAKRRSRLEGLLAYMCKLISINGCKNCMNILRGICLSTAVRTSFEDYVDWMVNLSHSLRFWLTGCSSGLGVVPPKNIFPYVSVLSRWNPGGRRTTWWLCSPMHNLANSRRSRSFCPVSCWNSGCRMISLHIDSIQWEQ